MNILVTGGSGFFGTNFTEYIYNNYPKNSIINIDIVKPKVNFANAIWIKCDILDKESLLKVTNEYKPEVIIHFAAETSCEEGLKMSDFKVNTQGSKNVFEVADEVESVNKVVHTSTQFINQFDFPLNDYLNYRPHTVYGESKIISEKMLINGKFNFYWAIVRPTNIWGKWHLRYPNEFWKVLYQGKYLHPNKKNVIRSYGYIGNVCDQIFQLTKLIEKHNHEIFYVGDEPAPLYDWVNGFSVALTGKNVRTVNPIFVKALAIIGDLLKILKINFPITTSRFKSMTMSNPAPMSKTLEVLGKTKYTLSNGISETVSWLKTYPNYQK